MLVRTEVLSSIVAATLLVCPAPSHAEVVEFGQNVSTNSTDWSSYVVGLGGVVDEINFDTHPVGTLINDFYSASHGVTFSTTGRFDMVVNGSGPAQIGSTGPRSMGEGPHPISRHLYAPDVESSLTITFDRPVLGAGLSVIDLFNPGSQPSTRNAVTLSAYTGPDGGGAQLTMLDSSQFNFQPNYVYFMGIASSDRNIRSLRFDHPGVVADEIGVDDIRFAFVPEPSAVVLLLGLMLGASHARFWSSRRLGRYRNTIA